MDNQLEVGKTYNVVSQRKGSFTVRITRQDDTWVSGIIIRTEKAYNLNSGEADGTEEVTLRKSLTTFTEIS